MNAWLKICVFNLYLNRESVSERRTLSGSLGTVRFNFRIDECKGT